MHIIVKKKQNICLLQAFQYFVIFYMNKVVSFNIADKNLTIFQPNLFDSYLALALAAACSALFAGEHVWHIKDELMPPIPASRNLVYYPDLICYRRVELT